MKIDIEKALTDITNNFNETVKPSNHLTGPQIKVITSLLEALEFQIEPYTKEELQYELPYIITNIIENLPEDWFYDPEQIKSKIKDMIEEETDEEKLLEIYQYISRI